MVSSMRCSRPCQVCHEHGCSYGEAGGFIRRMTEDEGTWLGHVLEHVAIELQNVAGAHVTFGKTRETTQPGVYDVVFEYEQEDVGLEAAEVAVDLLQSLLPAERSATRSGRARRRSWRRPRPAASRGSGSTSRSSCSSGTGGTSSGSRPPSPAPPATSPSRSPPTRRRPGTSSRGSACPSPASSSSTPPRPPSRPPRRSATPS
jgi:hypothetical protein